MVPIEFKRAYYIKLGRGGEWERSSIAESKLRLGFRGQSLGDINSGNWETIRKQLSTRDLNALRWICESTSQDLWITFYQDMMWWCRLGANEVLADNISKYRLVDGKWCNEDVKGHVLEIHSIPGVLSKTQAFRGTVCRVRQLDSLRRLVNSEASSAFSEITECEIAIVSSVEKGIRQLYWKDFETFVDLAFRESGWRRLSMLGGPVKSVDLELEDPITQDKYQVQVKSQASLRDFQLCANGFDSQHHRKLYFVVHSPDNDLSAFHESLPGVELVLPGRLSEMAVRLGLVDWLKTRIK